MLVDNADISGRNFFLSNERRYHLKKVNRLRPMDRSRSLDPPSVPLTLTRGTRGSFSVQAGHPGVRWIDEAAIDLALPARRKVINVIASAATTG